MTSQLNTILAQGYKGKPDSTWQPRCTAKQQAIIEDVALSIGQPVNLDALARYVATGDLDKLDPATYALLTKIVDQCKARAANESQAKRYWPRKVAAVVIEAIS